MKNILSRLTSLFRQAPSLAQESQGAGSDSVNPVYGYEFNNDFTDQDANDQMKEAQRAWRVNGMARRIYDLIVPFTIGSGFQVYSLDEEFNAFIQLFWHHELNEMQQRMQIILSDLVVFGELYPVLHTSEVTGMSILRMIPPLRIRKVVVDDDDFEIELAYREYVFLKEGTSPKVWYTPNSKPDMPGEPIVPWALRFTVNRLNGQMRGISDLGAALPWIKRYNGWLIGRLMLHKAAQLFLWFVKAPAHAVAKLQKEYAKTPKPGTTVVHPDTEEWDVKAPNLGSRGSVEGDARNFKWTIAAAGPGTSLSDFGEHVGSNRATAAETAELRKRWILLRQGYLAYVIRRILVTAYNRYLWINRRGRPSKSVQLNDVIVRAPDVSVKDNKEIGESLASLMRALIQAKEFFGESEELQRVGYELFMSFSELEVMGDEQDFGSVQSGDSKNRGEAADG